MATATPPDRIWPIADVIGMIGLDPATTIDEIRQRVLKLRLEFKSTGREGPDGIGLGRGDIEKLAASYRRPIDWDFVGPKRPTTKPRRAVPRPARPVSEEAPSPGKPISEEAPSREVWSMADACRLLGKDPDTEFTSVRHRAKKLDIVFKPTQHANGKGLDRVDLERLAESFGVKLNWEVLSGPKRRGDWLLCSQVSRRLEIPSWNVPQLAMEAKIRVLRLPGRPPRYHKEDVEKLLLDSITVGGKPLHKGATV